MPWFLRGIALVSAAGWIAAGVACGPTESREVLPARGGEGATSSGGEPTGDGFNGPTADPDRDRLTNAEESERGTDPRNADTDADGYGDGDEVDEATDPLDPASRIYRGGWPYQRRKDEIPDPGFDAPAEFGARVPRFVGYDQFGERVDLYDFAFQGRFIVLDLAAPWCDGCLEIAKWLDGDPSTLDATARYEPVRERVASGELYWITVVFEDVEGHAVGPEGAVAWAEAFPNDRIPVLADNDRQLAAYIGSVGYPSLQLLDEDLTLLVYDRYAYPSALDYLVE